jgi:hypothetical protein
VKFGIFDQKFEGLALREFKRGLAVAARRDEDPLGGALVLRRAEKTADTLTPRPSSCNA